jgi:chorismate mutase
MRLAVRAAVLGALVCASYARPASAQQTHVLIITGLSAEPQYKAVFLRTAATLADSARLRWKVADSSLIVLGEDPADDPKHIKGKSTKEEVANAFLRLSKRVAPGDVLLVFLNGHGAGEGPGSRVNLPGPDPTAADYASWISGFARQTIVFVNAASGSGDFLPVLAGRGRIVVTATKTGIERNETVFAAPFVRGLTGTEADADKDGRVSIFEAFDFAKKEVARVYETDKKMLTEHAIMSDTILARRVSFGVPASGADPKIAALVAERQALESQVADLRARKASTDSTVYAAQLEKLLLELAEKSQAIRAAGGKP